MLVGAVEMMWESCPRGQGEDGVGIALLETSQEGFSWMGDKFLCQEGESHPPDPPQL